MGHLHQLDGAVVDRAHFPFDDLEHLQNADKVAAAVIDDLIWQIFDQLRSASNRASHIAQAIPEGGRVRDGRRGLSRESALKVAFGQSAGVVADCADAACASHAA
jgi:hypothetical protein